MDDAGREVPACGIRGTIKIAGALPDAQMSFIAVMPAVAIGRNLIFRNTTWCR